MNHPIARNASLLLVIGCLSFAAGCGGPPPLNGNIQAGEGRSQKLMALAVHEAGKIGNADMRLTRQLNLADVQIDRSWGEDAHATLADARTTLESPEAAKLNDQTRLSGWVSISELSRRISDKVGAATATDAAIMNLNRIEDPGNRCEYVMGIANELQYIRGKSAAADLLAGAGPWTSSIDNLAAKRQALTAFATALFNLDDFDAGQKMLERENDAAWRSDVLASMAQAAQVAQTKQDDRSVVLMAPEAMVAVPTATPAATLGPETSPTTGSPFFGKPLDYYQNFKNRKASEGTKE